MKNSVLVVVFSAVAILAMGGVVNADYISPIPKDFDDVFPGDATPVAIGSPAITSMSGGGLLAQVVSQVFTDEHGNYAYLYLVQNTGGAGNSEIESFTVSPMNGATDGTVLGWLTGDAPSDFTNYPGAARRSTPWEPRWTRVPVRPSPSVFPAPSLPPFQTMPLTRATKVQPST